MIKKILIISSASRDIGAWENQLGSAAILISTIKALKGFIPDAEISTSIQLSGKFCKSYGIKSLSDEVFWKDSHTIILKSLVDLAKCGIWRLLQKFVRLNIETLTRGKKLGEYANADVILDLGGDTYSSQSLRWIVLVKHSAELLTIRLMKKRVILFAVSPGPFYPKPILLLAKFTLNRVTLIITREPLSNDYLKRIGINKTPIVTTTCPAFLLEPASKERAKAILLHEGINQNERLLIGVALTRHNLYSYRNWRIPPTSKDLSSYVQVVKYLLDDLKACVILIPHVHHTNQLTGEPIHGPDYVILRRLYQLVDGDSYKGRIILIDGMYSPPEVKAMIGQVDLFISGRLHAGIAALSQAIPTVLIAYGRKHYGIAKLLNQENYVYHGRVPEDTISIIRDALEKRERIKRLLREKAIRVRELTNLNFEIVKEILNLSKKEGDRIPKEKIDGWLNRAE